MLICLHNYLGYATLLLTLLSITHLFVSQWNLMSQKFLQDEKFEAVCNLVTIIDYRLFQVGTQSLNILLEMIHTTA